MPPEATARRAIILCADDYGIAAGVGAAIRDLLANGRLSAVSCMTVFPDFGAEAAALQPFAANADLGLHLTLTENRTLGALLRDAYSGTLDRKAMAHEIDRQIALFVGAFGAPPAFIDGHRHVHALPSVREHVLARAAELGAVVRILKAPSLTANQPSPLKGKGLAVIGAALTRTAASRGLAANSEFRGARSFKETAPYRTLFTRMLAGAPDGCLIMCHPGLADEVLASRDAVAAAREGEYRYLASAEFQSDLAAAQVQLGRMPRQR